MMNKKEIAAIHIGEQGKVDRIWSENNCLFAHFIGRLCSLGRKVKFSELTFLNKKAQKRALEIANSLTSKNIKSLPEEPSSVFPQKASA